MALMMTTNTSATVVYVISSLRVGHITFRSSAATCLVNRAGVVRSRLAARPDPPRRSALWPRVWVAMSSPVQHCTDPTARAGRTVLVPQVRTGRAGGTRTPNRRFWRPGLYQLSYCPPDLQSPECTSNPPVPSNRRTDAPERETSWRYSALE